MPQKMSAHIIEAVQADLRRDFWYTKGNATFNPSLPHMREPGAIEDYILQGWLPPEPFITPSTKLTFIGCCFGSALIKHIETLDFEQPSHFDNQFIPISETLSTSFAMRQMFEWQFEGIKPDRDLAKGNRVVEINFSDELWKGTLERLAVTDVFVLMISSAEVWYDEPTGAVVWRETPGANPARQKFRTSTAEENRHNIRTIYDIVRKHRPQAKIIFLLSPIPMIATYREQSCITANAVSKAVIRVAMDEVWRDVNDEGYFLYWPFYEVVIEGFGANPYGGHFNGDRRHINDPALDYLLRLFEKYYCKVRSLSRPVLQAYVDAKVSTTELPRELVAVVDRGDRRGIQKMIDDYEAADDDPTADLVAAYASERLGLSRTDDHDRMFDLADLVWQSSPDGKVIGVAPQTIALPSAAWAYGAFCQPLQAEAGKDLLVRVRLSVVVGATSVLLTHPDGSLICQSHRRIGPEDGSVEIELDLHHDDGVALLVVRNYDSEGVAVMIQVEAVSTKSVPVAAPVRRSANGTAAL